jgi:TolA-binding protein
MTTGDMEGAERVFSEYIEVYPNGYNAYDSMGEYYLKNEKMDDAESMYKKAVENYPFARNANSIIANKINTLSRY